MSQCVQHTHTSTYKVCLEGQEPQRETDSDIISVRLHLTESGRPITNTNTHTNKQQPTHTHTHQHTHTHTHTHPHTHTNPQPSNTIVTRACPNHGINTGVCVCDVG